MFGVFLIAWHFAGAPAFMGSHRGAPDAFILVAASGVAMQPMAMPPDACRAIAQGINGVGAAQKPSNIEASCETAQAFQSEMMLRGKCILAYTDFVGADGKRTPGEQIAYVLQHYTCSN